MSEQLIIAVANLILTKTRTSKQWNRRGMRTEHTVRIQRAHILRLVRVEGTDLNLMRQRDRFVLGREHLRHRPVQVGNHLLKFTCPKYTGLETVGSQKERQEGEAGGWKEGTYRRIDADLAVEALTELLHVLQVDVEERPTRDRNLWQTFCSVQKTAAQITTNFGNSTP